MPKSTERDPAPSLELVAKPAPETVLLFLKHAALETEWASADLADTLGIEGAIAKQIVENLALIGYIEAVPASGDRWRNTASGNSVSGVRPPRLRRETAEDLLSDIGDRAAAFNLESERPVHVAKIVAFGAINQRHERIQDIDLAVEFRTKPGRETTQADTEAALKALRGRSPSIKMHSIQGWPKRMGRAVWES
jgi:hypothetical protein